MFAYIRMHPNMHTYMQTHTLKSSVPDHYYKYCSFVSILGLQFYGAFDIHPVPFGKC